MSTRIEHDLLGDRAVPAAAYWGVHTLRAVENFPITGQTIASYGDLIIALAQIKKAAAQANRDLGLWMTCVPRPLSMLAKNWWMASCTISSWWM
jgi:aspartate ammonia-lyase